MKGVGTALIPTVDDLHAFHAVFTKGLLLHELSDTYITFSVDLVSKLEPCHARYGTNGTRQLNTELSIPDSFEYPSVQGFLLACEIERLLQPTSGSE